MPERKAKPMKGDQQMFTPPPEVKPETRRSKPASSRKLWTRDKASLIERYIYGFVMVAKHGTYIDGFAGWQHPGVHETWAAYRVLELEPRWMKRFLLFDNDPKTILPLEELRSKHNKDGRQVKVFEQDFNEGVSRILIPEYVPPAHATFCLIDQRTFECHWDTVAALANYKRNTEFKIEVFYFLARGWFDRTVAGRTSDTGRAGIRAWWGREDVDEVIRMSAFTRAETLEKRFTEELGYNFSRKFAIYDPEQPTRVMYYMIHATDHPRGSDLMDNAYESVVKPGPWDQLRL
jgi:three-Cys-motif partner protein